MALDDAVLQRKTSLLYRNTVIGQAVSMVNGVILVVLMTSLFQVSWAYWWLAAALLAAAGRMLLALGYHRDGAREVRAAVWCRRHVWGAWAAGMVWGSAAVVFMLGQADVPQLFTVFLLSGMVAGAVPMLAPVLPAFKAFSVPVVLSVALIALSQYPSHLHLALGVMALLFLGAVLRSARYLHDTLDGAIRLELGKDELLVHLEEARRQAEDSSRVKSQFLTNMSHEMRTPMNGVLGMADLLSYSPLDGDQADYVEAIKSSGRAMLATIDGILDLANIDGGRVSLVSQPFSVAEIARTLEVALKPRAIAKGLTLLCVVSEAVPGVLLGDEGRLRQVLNNLLDNGIKFTERGQVGLTVDVASRTHDQVTIRFVVADSGIGIPPEKLGLIFEDFNQADNSVSRKYGGSGLGLSVAQRLVAMMGGCLSVSSHPGAGSCFTFAVPFKLSD